jgi:DNA-binding MltR family transcriptional regulator
MVRQQKIPTEQLSEESRELYDVLNDEKDLAVILIATSFIDACLKSILENRLLESRVTEKLLSHTGVVGSLSTRADVCYVLGLVSKAYRDIQTMAEIRNLVAHHHLQLSFTSPKVAELCEKLSSLEASDEVAEHPRHRFKMCAVLTANWPLREALRLKRQPPTKAMPDPSVRALEFKRADT